MNLDDKVAVITEKIHDKERPSTTGCVFPPVRSARQSTCLWSLTSILTASPKNGFVRKAASSREPSAISVPLPASSSNFPTFLTMHLIFCPRKKTVSNLAADIPGRPSYDNRCQYLIVPATSVDTTSSSGKFKPAGSERPGPCLRCQCSRKRGPYPHPPAQQFRGGPRISLYPPKRCLGRS